MATSDCEGDATTVVAVAELFAEFGSPPAAEMLAISEITVPGVVVATTATTSVNVTEGGDIAKVAFVQVIVPVPPTAGIVAPQPQPVGTERETNVVFAGTASL
jgi:hypothetical protein